MSAAQACAPAEAAPAAACHVASGLAEGHAAGGSVFCLAALRQPSCFATGGSDGAVCLWAPVPRDGDAERAAGASGASQGPFAGAFFLAPYRCLQRLQGHQGEVRCLALLEGGALLSGGWDAALRLWAPVTESGSSADHSAPPAFGAAGEWRGHEGPVWAVCALRDGGAASAGADATVRLWSAPLSSKSNEGAAPVLPRRVLYGHTEDVCALAPLACGLRLASGGTDGTVRLWRLADGAAEAILKGHSDSVTALAAVRGGGAASASADRAVRVWRALPPSVASPSDAATPPQPLSPPSPVSIQNNGSSGGNAGLEDCFFAPLRCLLGALPGLAQRVPAPRGSSGGPACGTSVLQGHAQALAALALLPDGRLVSAGADAALCVWSQAAPPAPGAPPSPRHYDPTAAAQALPTDTQNATWRVDRVLQRPEPVGQASSAGAGEAHATAHHHRPFTALAALSWDAQRPALLLAAAFGARVRVWDVAASDVAADVSTSRDE